MGSNVGEIKYGVKIAWKQVEVLKEKFNVDCYSEIEFNDDPVEVYEAYETEDFMLVVKQAPSYSAYNCMKLLKSNFAEINDSWKTDIIQFCEKYGLECDQSKIGWYLMGRYD
jgi:hypothetical protein